MEVRKEGKKIIVRVDKKIQIKRMLKELHLNPEIHVVFIDGNIATEDLIAKPENKIEIVRVVSTG